MLQHKTALRSSVMFAIGLASFVGWSAADVRAERFVPVQAPLPPATKELAPAQPLQAPLGDPGPLLTPEIRPRGKDLGPELKPDSPEKKAEPKVRQAPPAGLKGGTAVPGGKNAGKQPPAKPGLAVAQPRTAAERDKALADLYAYLATAEDAKQAETVSGSIERLWVTAGSDTVSLLMQRAMQAANSKNPDLALKLLDAVVSLAPDYSEGWNRRAYVHYSQNHIDLALGDLRRTLALDPNHFKALDGLIHILTDIGRKKEALQAARRLLEVNPYYTGVKQIVDELARELEGRGI